MASTEVRRLNDAARLGVMGRLFGRWCGEELVEELGVRRRGWEGERLWRVSERLRRLGLHLFGNSLEAEDGGKE